ncbi:MAG: ferrochelatase [Bauldia sp.]|uniref:ferrochelatase n=1 Tax=Bauldia sp. TaxID=2575872 RepID=UPI001D1D6B7A|nr:ferrochelatase [Bauldia sp.]MCB1496534.1 ferrochelatase [Bauldia sp.]
MNAESPTDTDSSGHMPAGHPPVRFGRVGVLLVNLGSPSGTDYRSVRRYLKQFLWDRRVIEVARPLWWLILNGIVLSTRPQKTGHAYRTIWNDERDEAPLITISRAQAEKLAARLAGDGVVVDWAMRYGEPAIGERIEALKGQGCDRILVAPLYPQYAAATTATVNDVAFDTLKAMRWQPAIRTLPSYHDDPVYIDALADSLTAGLAGLDFEPELVLASFHGLPRDYLDKGDPYHCHCQKTTRLLRETLGWPEERLKICFQSRFGKAEWLQPYFEETVTDLARSGTKRLAVIMPGFSADCLETLEEIAMRGGETFRESGGEDYAAIACLNDSEPGMRLIEHLARRELAGWI